MRKELSLNDFFTADAETIRYRAELFMELLAKQEVFGILNDLLPNVEAFSDVQSMKDTQGDTESSLFVILEIELYLECMDTLSGSLAKHTLQSESLKGFKAAVTEITDSENFKTLKTEVSKLSFKVSNIKSVTFGANLDAQFRPREAGLISINDKPFISGSVMDKLLRAGNKQDAETCISSLVPLVGKGTRLTDDSLRLAFLGALNGLLNKSARTWKTVINQYLLGVRSFLTNLLGDVQFIIAVTKQLLRLQNKNFPLAVPVLVEKGQEEIRGLYNPLTALKMADSSEMVYNNLSFDKNGLIYILTGPNAGGKSVFLHAAGFAYAMLHLGLPIPARSARMCLIDGLHTHF